MMLIALPGVALPQDRPAPEVGGTLPSIGLPLPGLGYPLPSLGLPPLEAPIATTTPWRQRPGRNRGRGLGAPAIVYVLPIFYEPPVPPPPPEPAVTVYADNEGRASAVVSRESRVGDRDTRAEKTEPSAAARVEEAAPARKTYYIIPGCYMGDVDPTEVRLPFGCDPARAVTIKPEP
jgi:hypothetical protein